MKGVLNLILRFRAHRLAKRLKAHLPEAGWALDIGSGTGHTVQTLRQQTALRFVETDVVDISVVGAGPVLFNGKKLPFADGAFACSLIMFVLHYPQDPLQLLQEANRVTAGHILVLQSTCRGQLGHVALSVNEFLWGPVAFLVARAVRLIRECKFTLNAQRSFSRDELQTLFQEAGFSIQALLPRPWPDLPVSCDLFILEGNRVGANSKGHIGNNSGQE